MCLFEALLVLHPRVDNGTITEDYFLFLGQFVVWEDYVILTQQPTALLIS